MLAQNIESMIHDCRGAEAVFDIISGHCKSLSISKSLSSTSIDGIGDMILKLSEEQCSVAIVSEKILCIVGDTIFDKGVDHDIASSGPFLISLVHILRRRSWSSPLCHKYFSTHRSYALATRLLLDLVQETSTTKLLVDNLQALGLFHELLHALGENIGRDIRFHTQEMALDILLRLYMYNVKFGANDDRFLVNFVPPIISSSLQDCKIGPRMLLKDMRPTLMKLNSEGQSIDSVKTKSLSVETCGATSRRKLGEDCWIDFGTFTLSFALLASDSMISFDYDRIKRIHFALSPPSVKILLDILPEDPDGLILEVEKRTVPTLYVEFYDQRACSMAQEILTVRLAETEELVLFGIEGQEKDPAKKKLSVVSTRFPNSRHSLIAPRDGQKATVAKMGLSQSSGWESTGHLTSPANDSLSDSTAEQTNAATISFIPRHMSNATNAKKRLEFPSRVDAKTIANPAQSSVIVVTGPRGKRSHEANKLAPLLPDKDIPTKLRSTQKTRKALSEISSNVQTPSNALTGKAAIEPRKRGAAKVTPATALASAVVSSSPATELQIFNREPNSRSAVKSISNSQRSCGLMRASADDTSVFDYDLPDDQDIPAVDRSRIKRAKVDNSVATTEPARILTTDFASRSTTSDKRYGNKASFGSKAGAKSTVSEKQASPSIRARMRGKGTADAPFTVAILKSTVEDSTMPSTRSRSRSTKSPAGNKTLVASIPNTSTSASAKANANTGVRRRSSASVLETVKTPFAKVTEQSITCPVYFEQSMEQLHEDNGVGQLFEGDNIDGANEKLTAVEDPTQQIASTLPQEPSAALVGVEDRIATDATTAASAGASPSSAPVYTSVSDLYDGQHVETAAIKESGESIAPNKDVALPAARKDHRAGREDPNTARKDPRAARKDHRVDRQDSHASRKDPRAYREDPNAGRRDPRAAREDSMAGLEDPRADREDPNAARKDPRADREDQNKARKDPRADREDPNAAREDPRADREDPRADREDPRADREDPRAATRREPTASIVPQRTGSKPPDLSWKPASLRPQPTAPVLAAGTKSTILDSSHLAAAHATLRADARVSILEYSKHLRQQEEVEEVVEQAALSHNSSEEKLIRVRTTTQSVGHGSRQRREEPSLEIASRSTSTHHAQTVSTTTLRTTRSAVSGVKRTRDNGTPSDDDASHVGEDGLVGWPSDEAQLSSQSSLHAANRYNDGNDESRGHSSEDDEPNALLIMIVAELKEMQKARAARKRRKQMETAINAACGQVDSYLELWGRLANSSRSDAAQSHRQKTEALGAAIDAMLFPLDECAVDIEGSLNTEMQCLQGLSESVRSVQSAIGEVVSHMRVDETQAKQGGANRKKKALGEARKKLVGMQPAMGLQKHRPNLQALKAPSRGRIQELLEEM